MNSNLFRGSQYQRGYGPAGTFRRFFNWIVPLIKTHAMPVFSAVGKTALSAAADIAKDSVAGRDLRESARERIGTAVDSLKSQAEKKFRGEGIKRKRKFKKFVVLKSHSKKYKDIFDE